LTIETVWRERLGNSIHTLNQWVKTANQELQKNTNDSIIVGFFIDAADLEYLRKISYQYKRVYVISEHTINNQWDNVSIYNLQNDFYGVYYIPEIVDGVIKKDFNCFLNRTDAIRQSWFYLLYSRGLLDHGFVSFNMYQKQGLWYPSDDPLETFDYYHKEFLSSFDNIKEEIKQIVPYKNFIDNDNLCKIILSTKFSIIIETYFERIDCKTFSEKTWRAVQLPRPWLLFAATGCVQRLRDMGFDVFDDYVDHSYDLHDTSKTCVSRQEDILNETQRLSKLDITPRILDDWQQKALHNRNIMKIWANSWHSKCRIPFDQILKLESCT
jgi:hypothetical protein